MGPAYWPILHLALLLDACLVSVWRLMSVSPVPDLEKGAI